MYMTYFECTFQFVLLSKGVLNSLMVSTEAMEEDDNKVMYIFLVFILIQLLFVI